MRRLWRNLPKHRSGPSYNSQGELNLPAGPDLVSIIFARVSRAWTASIKSVLGKFPVRYDEYWIHFWPSVSPSRSLLWVEVQNPQNFTMVRTQAHMTWSLFSPHFILVPVAVLSEFQLLYGFWLHSSASQYWMLSRIALLSWDKPRNHPCSVLCNSS